jgi:hypothetical protein
MDKTLMARQFLSLALETAETQEQRWNRIIRLRQTLISMGVIAEAVMLERSSDRFAPQNPRFQFLNLVCEHHAMTKANEKNAANWLHLGESFRTIEDATGMVAFYKRCYFFLCIRKGEAENGDIARAGADAFGAVELIENDEESQFTRLDLEARGHMFYNLSRWKHEKNELSEALMLWKYAAKERIEFRDSLASVYPKTLPEVQLSADQQVAKMYRDFPTFFLGQQQSECGVPEELHATLATMHGNELYDFSAKPA